MLPHRQILQQPLRVRAHRANGVRAELQAQWSRRGFDRLNYGARSLRWVAWLRAIQGVHHAAPKLRAFIDAVRG
jgi:hypothetical protein